jgi:hypothetical protein
MRSHGQPVLDRLAISLEAVPSGELSPLIRLDAP